MSPRTRRFAIGLVALVYGVAILACSPEACTPAPASSSKPVVTITAPTAGAQVKVGETVTVQATAMDVAGVSRVELWVNNALVNTQNFPTPQPTAAATLKWVAAPVGAHALMVQAYNTGGTASDPVVVSVQVVEGAPEPTTTPTVTPSPTVPPPTSPPGCNDNAAFVEDVTIPDGTTMSTGTNFDKTWRLKNTGTCTWDSYELAFVSGEQMSAPAEVAVPATAPDKEADITVKMTAPRSAGNYTGKWRLRNKAGQAFGPTLVVIIAVSAAPPPATLPKADLEIVSMTIPGKNKLTLSVRNNQGEDLANRVVNVEFEASIDPGGQVGQKIGSPPVAKTVSVKSGQTIEVTLDTSFELDLTQHGYEIKATIGPKAGDPNTYEETNSANNSKTTTWQKQAAALPKADLTITSVSIGAGNKPVLRITNNGPDSLSNRTISVIPNVSYGTGTQINSPAFALIQKTISVNAGTFALVTLEEVPDIDLVQWEWYELGVAVEPIANDPNSYEETNPGNNSIQERWEQQVSKPKADLEATSIWGNAQTNYKLGLWVKNNGPDDLSGRIVEVIIAMSYGTGDQAFTPSFVPLQKTVTVQSGGQAMILIEESPTIDTSQYWYKISISVQPKAGDANSYDETAPANNTRYEEWAQQP